MLNYCITGYLTIQRVIEDYVRVVDSGPSKFMVQVKLRNELMVQ